MRLMNTAASIPYVHPSEREPEYLPPARDGEGKVISGQKAIPNPKAGQALSGATVWHLRAISSREDGALQDAIYDMSRTSAQQDKSGDTKVNLSISMSPSSLRRNRVRLGIVGWENLRDHAGDPIAFRKEEMTLGNRTFMAVPEEIIDMMPQMLISAIASEVEKLSSVTPTEGNV